MTVQIAKCAASNTLVTLGSEPLDRPECDVVTDDQWYTFTYRWDDCETKLLV